VSRFFHRLFDRSRSRRWLTVAAVVALTAGRVPRAHATDAAQAESLIRQGVELRQQGHDVPALPFFQKAHDLVSTPRTAGQLGLAEMALGYWLDAEQHIGEALASPDHPWVMKNSDILKQALARTQTNIGEVVITGSPSSAQVSVNRRAAGILPLGHPIRVAKGRIDVEVSAPGFATNAQSVQVKGGDRLFLTAELSRPTPVAGVSAGPASPGVTQPVSLAATGAPADPAKGASLTAMEGAPRGSGSSARREIGWGLGITSGVVLAGAIVETVIWQRKRSQFNTPSVGCYENQTMRGAPGCSALFDSARKAESFALIGYAAAAVLAGTATALLVTARPPEPQTAAMTCAPGVGSNLLSCRFRF